MIQLTSRAYHSIGVGLIFILLLLSVWVRQDNLNAPLSRHHEWITAHSLITAEIWEQNGGPSAYGFNPVYTYPGEGNSNRRSLGGITAKNGDVYYVSYPPFAFVFLYYASLPFGGTSVAAIRAINILIHFLCALLIYYLIRALQARDKQDKISFAGIIGAGLYLFAEGNLWIHGNLYFSDTVVQPLFIAGLLLSIRFFKKDCTKENRHLVLLFCVFFLATYTEWLGLFSAFYTGLAFLIAGLIRKEKRYFKAFFVLGFASALALGTTIYQYASIDGWETYKTISERKYAERSGHDTEAATGAQFNIHSSESFDLLTTKLNTNYKTIQNFIGISALLLIPFLVFRKNRLSVVQNQSTLTSSLLLLLLIILPTLTHYIVFFNFNAMHDFSGLKTGFFFVIVSAIIVLIITENMRIFNPYGQWVVLGFFILFFGLKAQQSTKRYIEAEPLSNIDYDRVTSAQTIRVFSSPDIAVFSNVRLSPEQMYYAKHSIFPMKAFDSTTVINIMNLYQNDKAHYYHHEGSQLVYRTTLTKKDRDLTISDTLIFE